MAEKKLFSLVATVSTENREGVRPVLEELVSGRGSVIETTTGNGDGSRRGQSSIEAEMEGESANELNRSLLSALRKVEKRTRLRAEWTSGEKKKITTARTETE
ncbi:MAG: hypothetical protein ABSA81_09125 [Candidatus Bathyarchaeia archaeon]|jgi:hypothetical protein